MTIALTLSLALGLGMLLLPASAGWAQQDKAAKTRIKAKREGFMVPRGRDYLFLEQVERYRSEKAKRRAEQRFNEL